MKPYLKISALAAAVLLIVSCSNELSEGVEEDPNDSTAVITNSNDSNAVDTTDIVSESDSIFNSAVGNQFIYVSLKKKEQIAVYKLDDEKGSLALIEEVDVDGSPGSIACSRNKDYLYVALRSTHQVASFKIDKATGKLGFIKNTPVTDNPVYIFPDKTNKYLLTAYWSGNKLAIYPIQGDSLIIKKATQVLDPGINPHSIVNHPSNKFTYAAVMTTGTVNQYAFNETNGTLKQLSPPVVNLGENIGPRHIDVHPFKNWVYIINEINNTLGHYNVDTISGTLTLKSTINTLPEDFIEYSKTADVHVTPNGKFVYASNRGHNSIVGYAINMQNGSLKLIGRFATEANPREFEMGTMGKYLFSGGEDTGRMQVYKILENGALETISTYDVGESITWISAIELKFQ